MKYLVNLYVNGKLHSQHKLSFVPRTGSYVRLSQDDPQRDDIDYKVEKVVAFLDTTAINLYVSKNLKTHA